MWKIYYKDQSGGQSPVFWGKKVQDLDVGKAKEMGRQDYITDTFLKYFPRTGKILDGGCGIGQHVLAYRDLGYQMEGLDFSAEAIQRIIDFDRDAPCRRGNILQIDAPDSYYDCYYSLGVFEHFEEGPAAAIKEARRVLKDNGIFILNVPYENFFRKVKFNILNLIGKVSGRSYSETSVGFIKKVKACYKPHGSDSHMRFHEYVCSKKEIIDLLTSNGFRIEYSSPCSIIWGLLEISWLKRFYMLIYSRLKKANNLSDGNKGNPGIIKTKKRSLLKDIFVYEKKEGAFKRPFITLLGILFGNLFLVVCRKA